MKMNRLKERLKTGKFIITAELEPPKGTDIKAFVSKAEMLKGWVDALNVTDNQRAMLRLSSAAGCTILQNMGIDSVFQVTSRDRNRLAIQSDLLGVYALGIRNVLAISGDYPTLGDHPGAKIVYDLDSVQILDLVSLMNKGLDLKERLLDGGTEFFQGAVFNPNIDIIELQLIKLKLKVDQGAKFFQTQIIYDLEKFQRFLDQFDQYGIDRDSVAIFAGILPLRSAKNAIFINKNVPGIMIPQKTIDRLANSSDPKRLGLELAADFINKLKDVCEGIHIMTVGREQIIPELLDIAGFKREDITQDCIKTTT
jgi:5,10-methylenetetrahydrofolate reductase